MRKNQFTGACLVTTLCLGLGLAGCQNKVTTEQKSSVAVSESIDAQSLGVSPEDAGVSGNMDGNEVGRGKSYRRTRTCGQSGRRGSIGKYGQQWRQL